MFYLEARKFINTLIKNQQQIKEHGYDRSDKIVVDDCMLTLSTLLKEYRYASNRKMANFWINHREEIRYILPTSKHTSFRIFLSQFEILDKQSKNFILENSNQYA